MKIAIIGGGASGISAAISIKKLYPDVSVCILERFDKIGKKILATGNGKCNIGNKNLSEKYYNNPEFVRNVISQMPLNEYLNYLESLGIYLKSDDSGRIYPFSESSKSVVEILIRNLNELNCEIVTNFDVVGIKKTGEKYEVISSSNGKKVFDKVIISCGSSSQTKEVRLDKILKQLDCHVNKPFPVLTPVKTKENIRDLSGVRYKCNVDVIIDEKVVFSEFGEVQFKDEGLGGIVILNASRFISLEKISFIKLNFIKNQNYDLNEYIKKNYNLSNYELLLGIVNPKIALRISKIVKTKKDIIKYLENFCLEVEDVYPFEFSQASRGGVSIKDVNSKTFESIKSPGLYVIGEALDIDGACGGYNLYFAFASGVILAKNLFTKSIE